MNKSPSICVAIPCLNEEKTIGKVIDDFRKELPQANLIVFDNDSVDQTVSVALAKNVLVNLVKHRGKGNVLQAIFEKIKDDFVVVVDGDDTYPAEAVHDLLKCAKEFKADMVIGTRHRDNNMRLLNRFGNRLLTGILNICFRTKFKDILSGYRVCSKDFVQSIPLLTTGFEVETEMNVQALEHRMIIKEVPIHYKKRPSDSRSKLRAFHDGYRILLTIAMLLRDHRPLQSFGMVAGSMAFLGGLSYFFVANELAPLFALSFLLIAVLMFLVGLILNAINTRIRELQMILRRK